MNSNVIIARIGLIKYINDNKNIITNKNIEETDLIDILKRFFNNTLKYFKLK